MIDKALVEASKKNLIGKPGPARYRVHTGADFYVEDEANGTEFYGPCQIEEISGCCAVGVVHGFESRISPEMASAFYLGLSLLTKRYARIFATTIPSQKDAIAMLKKAGFEEDETFKGNGRNDITFWYYVTR